MPPVSFGRMRRLTCYAVMGSRYAAYTAFSYKLQHRKAMKLR